MYLYIKLYEYEYVSKLARRLERLMRDVLDEIGDDHKRLEQLLVGKRVELAESLSMLSHTPFQTSLYTCIVHTILYIRYCILYGIYTCIVRNTEFLFEFIVYLVFRTGPANSGEARGIYSGASQRRLILS